MHAAALYRFYDGMHACSGSLPLQHSMMACMRAAVFYRLNTIIWHACGFDRCQPFRSSFVAGGGAACLSGGLIRLVLKEMAGSKDHIVEGLFAAELVNHDLGLHSFWVQKGGHETYISKKPLPWHEAPRRKNRWQHGVFKLRVRYYKTDSLNGIAHGRILKAKWHKWISHASYRLFTQGRFRGKVPSW